MNLPIIYKETRGNILITEVLFEEISDFLIGATKELTNNLIESIGLSWSDITGAILVGGSTRMRMRHNYVKEMSGKEPLSGINVDEAVALGAAIRANIDDAGNSISNGILGMIGGRKNVGVLGAKAVSDVTAHALGMIAVSEDGERYVNSVIIQKNTTIPAENKRSFNFRTRAKDNELEVYVLQGAYERPLDNTILDKYTINEIKELRYKIPRTTLNSTIKGQSILPICKELVEISYYTLKNECENEEIFLEPLMEMLKKGKCPADL